MKLKIADNSQYTKEQLKALKPHVDKDITVEQLPALARLAPIAIVYSESDDTHLAIAHPDCW